MNKINIEALGAEPDFMKAGMYKVGDQPIMGAVDFYRDDCQDSQEQAKPSKFSVALKQLKNFLKRIKNNEAKQ